MREHAPPPVQLDLGRGRMGRALVSLLAALAASAPALWLAHGAAALLVPLAAGAGWWWGRSPQGRLVWDGAAWCWRTPVQDQPGMAQIMLDLGDALVLRFVPTSGPPVGWWWLGRHEAGGAWHGLRVALVQQRRATSASA